MTGSIKLRSAAQFSKQLMETARHAVAATTATTPDTHMASALRLLFPDYRHKAHITAQKMTPDEMRESALEARRVVARLSWALRTERRLGRAGHWAYDINRHIALAQNLRGAQAVLAQNLPGSCTSKLSRARELKSAAPSAC